MSHQDASPASQPSIDALFIKSKGQPILYKGQMIQMVDRLSLTNGQALKLVFEQINSRWRQGVCLTTDGGFVVNDRPLIKNSIVLWHDTAPKEVWLQIETKKGECQIKNVWDTGDGVIHSWHNQSAMIVEEIDSGRRYKCNDGQANDDFNDLVFRLEILKG